MYCDARVRLRCVCIFCSGEFARTGELTKNEPVPAKAQADLFRCRVLFAALDSVRRTTAQVDTLHAIMPRPKKYDWDDKRDICWKLYVERDYSAGQIVQYFADHFNIPISELPGRNQFHAKFREWDFPRRNAKFDAEQEEVVTARIKELYNQNFPANEIQKRLLDEGWKLDNYYFRKFRRKHGLMLRAQDGYQYQTEWNSPQKKRKSSEDGAGGTDVVEGEALAESSRSAKKQRPEPPPLSQDEVARRQQRQVDLEIQSQQLLQTKKRRRRIRGFGNLPPDDPSMGPRYSSETSLDECKAFLQLDNEKYVSMRGQFEAICREMGIMKPTLCAEGQWQAAKDRLVRENSHLAAVLHPLQPDVDKRLNAMNCICSDVTKRMRNQSKAMSIADANNLLHLNPGQSKDLRRQLYEILEADHFTTVFACGKEHVDELRQRWIDKSPVLQGALTNGDKEVVRAVDLLAKDARKRYCDDQCKKDPTRRQWYKDKHYGPGPGPAQGGGGKRPVPKSFAEQQDPPVINAQSQANHARTAATETGQSGPIVPLGPAWNGVDAPPFRTTTIADMHPPINFDLDPLLLPEQSPWQQAPSNPRPSHQHQANPSRAALTAYFRLAPESQLTGHHPRMWLGKLASPTLEALYTAATAKSGSSRVAKIHGLAKNADGSEDRWLIESDDELAVYVEEAGEKSTFLVVLVGGYA